MENALLWVTAGGTALTAAATIGLAWVAWRTLGGARDQLVLLQRQAAREDHTWWPRSCLGFMGPDHLT
ncbi:Uncharacterised protein [Mycobacteroides abscessus subsp. abscessus]|uniref:Uncharacterized protein n=2 Tax=Mycobacteroides abscessus TaxID=36809 RepID=A0AB33T3F5_9MYCO|nr:hypothetical protein [Mycobacteroides abscessus]EIC62439.1 hypothetical protein S7W_23736 [Mycobacteroides abscessus M94]EUA46042.1 hypothetical protein I543_1063 [Mycobacteroides abscessus 21]MBE5494471.1 hypothetical protein [Mycobacteroides abscessus]CPT40612.1 Uncharacterised protein [Mycobacteroides abscessus]CPT42296.1 Uncharacterised protein [Mycobacteroides abscessus]